MTFLELLCTRLLPGAVMLLGFAFVALGEPLAGLVVIGLAAWAVIDMEREYDRV